LSIKIAEAHKRCKICSNYRAQRYCPRTGKDICWLCCNEKRIDYKCPQECAYILQKGQGNEFENSIKKAKVDSFQELSSLTTRLFDQWCEVPSDLFKDRIPTEMAQTEDGKKELEQYFNRIAPFLVLPERYLQRKLNLKIKTGLENKDNYEYFSGEYLEKMIAQEWEDSIQLLYSQDKYSEELYRSNYIIRRTGNRLLKQITSYHIILSAVSENRQEALVYYEINNKYDLSIIMGKINDRWLVKELIIGSPSFYYGEREAIMLISGCISKQEMPKAKQYIDQYSEILIDSADVHYLNGLYHLLEKDYQTALKYYLTAVELDPEFYEYKYNLALIYQMLKNYEVAEKLYQQLREQKSDDINVLNNLAIIYEDQGKEEAALSLLEECLKLDPGAELAKKNIERIKNRKS
jgi:tetratricopeptide (TPR) repeat protein